MKKYIMTAALILVGCDASPEPNAPKPAQQPFAASDAASTVPDATVPVTTPDSAVVGLVDETCDAETLRCPDGRGCVNLQAFGIQPSVCFKAGRTEKDINCPAGTHIASSFDGVPPWHCAAN